MNSSDGGVKQPTLTKMETTKVTTRTKTNLRISRRRSMTRCRARGKKKAKRVRNRQMKLTWTLKGVVSRSKKTSCLLNRR